MWEPEEHLIAGVWDFNVGRDASQVPNDFEGIGHRHLKGAVIMGFDGRVEFIPFEKFQAEGRRRPGLLWCVPNSVFGE